MSGIQQADAEDGLIYMVIGVDEHGDTHIFVSSDLGRAEAQYALMLDKFSEVKANWLESG